MKPYRISFLGGLRFEGGGQFITRFRTQKTATLLAYLALHRGPQPREVLADLLWPDDAPDDARHSLRVALSSLRHQLESALQTCAQSREPLFTATRFAIGLHQDAVSTDVADFDAALQCVRRAPDSNERARLYGVAVELYGGAFLPGFYDDWCLETATRLENEASEALHFLVKWHRARGQTAQAADYARRATALGIELDDDAQARVTSASSAATPDEKPTAATPARQTSGATLATLLLFDGAPLTPAIKKHLRAAGGQPLQTPLACEPAAQIWIFAGASAALEGALPLRGDEQARRIAVCSGEMTRPGGEALQRRGLGLLESAAAGQLLCCEATALFEREHAGITCRALGRFHLPDAAPGAAPERIFQVEWRGETARAFPPPRARSARGAQVPRPLGQFFGRESELELLRAHLENERLITLAGAGGSGKTRLAQQLAGEMETQHAAPFHGVVFWVALADVPDAPGIAGAICHALGIQPGADTPALEAAITELGRAPATLLVLDNFEHLVEHGAAVVERLLESTPGAHCLITSRRVLGARGEIEVTLAPLSVPLASAETVTVEALRDEPSVSLFCDRARLARPDFALTERTAAPVAALCRHLEGIPLAIELAAARVGNLSPARILERLQIHQSATTDAPENGANAPENGDTPVFERLDFLQGTSRTAPARHRTLRAALSWSYEELDAQRQTLFARLCVFRGGCTAEAARQVCRAPGATEDLEELRARSLLWRDYDADEARYLMLETVRQYAFEVACGRGEIEATRRRHAGYFLDWAQNEASHSVAPDAAARVQSWERVRVQAGNLRAAIRWSIASDPAIALQLMLACHNFSGAHLSHADLDIADALRAATPQHVAFEVLSRALGLAATQAAHRGDVAAQTEFARRRLELVRQTPDAPPDAVAWAYFDWGSARHRRGHVEQARAALEQSLALFDEIDAPHRHQCRGWTLIEMGNNAFDAGDLETAARDFKACFAAFARSGDRDGQASAQAQLADVSFHAGEYSRAAKLWRKVASIECELGDAREHEWRRHSEGKLAVACGDLERGRALLLRALREFQRSGQKLGMLRSLLALGHYWMARQRPERALQLLQVEAAQRAQWNWSLDRSWQPLRQRLWDKASASLDDAKIPSLEIIVEEELCAGQ